MAVGTPALIVVSGPPGSGKTTLAEPLARSLGWPLLSRDAIKQGMVFSHPGFVPAPSDPLTRRTYGLFFAAITLLVRAEVSLVAEAAFARPLWWQGLEPLADHVRLRVIRCRVPDAVARRRARERMVIEPVRAAHADAEHLAQPLAFEPLEIDAPVLDVDTSVAGWRPDLDAVIGFCRRE